MSYGSALEWEDFIVSRHGSLSAPSRRLTPAVSGSARVAAGPRNSAALCVSFLSRPSGLPGRG